MSTKHKPRILIIGHGRHGKDTAAELLQELAELNFISSSQFALERAVWPMWGKERYSSLEECFEDRHNHRDVWKGLIKAYNTPNLNRIHEEMFADGYNMYVGMRDRNEFLAATENGVFDVVVWIDRSKHLPPEDESSMELNAEDADIIVDNNQDVEHLRNGLKNLCQHMERGGFDMGQEETKVEQVDLSVVPEGATKLLDHGYIVLTDKGGSDEKIAEAARQSYGQGTKTVRSGEGLIRYLVTNHHTSPLEMGNLTFQMRLPIFIMRQLVRQRTAKLNEYSGRYSVMPELFYVPETSEICLQHATNKQGSGEPLDIEHAEMIQHTIRIQSEEAFVTYRRLLENGVSRETARIILPLNTYTVVTWQMDMNNLLKFLYLRDDEHAQWEIQVYAREIAKFVEQEFPHVYAAYMRQRSRISLTADQVFALLAGVTDHLPKGEAAQIEKIWLDYSNRVAQEI